MCHNCYNQRGKSRLAKSTWVESQDPEVWLPLEKSDKEYNLDWKNIVGPDDYDTPVFYRGRKYEGDYVDDKKEGVL